MGAIYDSYKMRIYVQILDDKNGFSFYNIPTEIIVEPNIPLLNSLLNSVNNPTSNPLINQLYNGETLANIQNILALSSLINLNSLSDQKSIFLKVKINLALYKTLLLKIKIQKREIYFKWGKNINIFYFTNNFRIKSNNYELFLWTPKFLYRSSSGKFKQLEYF